MASRAAASRERNRCSQQQRETRRCLAVGVGGEKSERLRRSAGPPFRRGFQFIASEVAGERRVGQLDPLLELGTIAVG